MRFVFLLVWLLVSVALCEDPDATRLLKRFNVIPDVIDNGPRFLAVVKYKNGVVVHRGNKLTADQVETKPVIDSVVDCRTSVHTLIVVDPDSPNPANPTMRSWLLWLVVNMPDKMTWQGRTLASYSFAHPDGTSGLHRYVFLLFKQPYNIKFDTVGSRMNFSVKNFVKKYALGVPISANLFRVNFDAPKEKPATT